MTDVRDAPGPVEPRQERQVVTTSRSLTLLYERATGPQWCASTRLAMWPNRSWSSASRAVWVFSSFPECPEFPRYDSPHCPANRCLFCCPESESEEAISTWP